MKIPPHITAVFFDLNGTLLRDRDFHERAMREVFTEEGVEISDEDYQKNVANHLNQEIWPTVLHRPVPLEEMDVLTDRKEQKYLALLPQSRRATPGAPALISKLNEKGIKTALVTTYPTSTLNEVLEYIGLLGAFSLIVSGSDITHGKPDPEIYLKALERAGVTAQETWAFEDSPQGVTSATAAGIFTVGVLPEYSKASLEACGASEFVNDFTEVEI